MMSLRNMLERDEARVPHAYPDSLGYLTIGVGHLIDKRKGGRLPDVIIDALLDYDIAEKTAEVVKALPWFGQLNEPRKAVIVSMAFQLGTDGLLEFKTALAAMSAANYDRAAWAFLQSKVAKYQTPERWQRHARQIQTGEWQ